MRTRTVDAGYSAIIESSGGPCKVEKRNGLEKERSNGVGQRGLRKPVDGGVVLRTTPPRASLPLLHRDPLRPNRLRLGQVNAQHTILALGADLAAVDRFVYGERPVEVADLVLVEQV